LTATGFTFRFQQILDAKERQEQVLEVEIGHLARAMLAQESALAGWARIRRDTLRGLRRARERADLTENARCADYLRYVRAQMEEVRRTISGLREATERVRQELQRVMQSRKVLENYRDRLKAEFMAVQEKAEERVLEEHAVRGFIRAEEIT
jgi:flagellar export protein FliJ